MPELDGKTPVKPTPFDAHDQELRKPNEAPATEYPKAVAHNEGRTEPVLALNEAHEAELADAAEEAAPEKDEAPARRSRRSQSAGE